MATFEQIKENFLGYAKANNYADIYDILSNYQINKTDLNALLKQIERYVNKNNYNNILTTINSGTGTNLMNLFIDLLIRMIVTQQNNIDTQYNDIKKNLQYSIKNSTLWIKYCSLKSGILPYLSPLIYQYNSELKINSELNYYYDNYDDSLQIITKCNVYKNNINQIIINVAKYLEDGTTVTQLTTTELNDYKNFILKIIGISYNIYVVKSSSPDVITYDLKVFYDQNILFGDILSTIKNSIKLYIDSVSNSANENNIFYYSEFIGNITNINGVLGVEVNSITIGNQILAEKTNSTLNIYYQKFDISSGYLNINQNSSIELISI